MKDVRQEQDLTNQDLDSPVDLAYVRRGENNLGAVWMDPLLGLVDKGPLPSISVQKLWEWMQPSADGLVLECCHKVINLVILSAVAMLPQDLWTEVAASILQSIANPLRSSSQNSSL